MFFNMKKKLEVSTPIVEDEKATCEISNEVDNKHYEQNGVEYEITKRFLTANEVGNIVQTSLQAYKNNNFIDNYNFSPVDMEVNFYSALFSYIIKDYSIETEDRFEELYNAGVQYDLLNNITNAMEAYNITMKLADKISDPINNILGTLFNKLPEKEDLEKLPEEWKKVTSEFNEIVKNKNEGETN